MTVGKYAGKLLRESFHRPLVVLEIIEATGIVIIHPLERSFPEWKETLDAVQMSFAALLVATFFVGLLVAGYVLHAKEEKDKEDCQERQKPHLEIRPGVPKSTGTHQRIKVHNKSGITVRFSTKILSIELPLPHYDKIPNFLQIDDSDHPHHKEANIEGGGDALVNVIAWIGTETFPNAGTPAYGLLIASPLIMNNPSAGAITLPTGHYKILVQAFPVDPQGPASEPREFYITPQPDGHMLLSDAGIPSERR